MSREHRRVNDILLGPLERAALRWLAERMPGWVTPDVLTGIGIVGAALTFAGYWLSGSAAAFLWLASFGLVVNWFGDSLDGTLARYRRIERPKFGFFIDHTVDAVSESLVVFGLGLSPYVSFEVAAVALIGYLLMSVLVYVRTYVTGEFRLSYGKVGPTEVRLILILFNAVLFFVGVRTVRLWFGEVVVYDLAIGALGAALIGVFLVSTFREARRLSKVGE